MPGPEVAVKERAPFQAAPITAPMAEISSSAWMMANLFFPVSLSTRYFLQCLANASAQEVEGVMGYQAATVGPPIDASQSRRIIAVDEDAVLDRVGAFHPEAALALEFGARM